MLHICNLLSWEISRIILKTQQQIPFRLKARNKNSQCNNLLVGDVELMVRKLQKFYINARKTFVISANKVFQNVIRTKQLLRKKQVDRK